MSEPREHTRDECRRMFLGHIRATSRYWATVDSPDGPKTTQERLDGLAFSILAMLDGCASVPGFQVIPAPHPDDRAYHQEQGENWWPSDVDIAGSLHEEWHRHD